MDFEYIIADPTGNITVLICSPYTDATRQSMIRQSFENVPSCEQVGFIMPVSDKTVRLEMMGYEFCGNATLSAAAWYSGTHGLMPGQEDIITVYSSGVDGPLSVSVRRPAVDSAVIQSAGHEDMLAAASVDIQSAGHEDMLVAGSVDIQSVGHEDVQTDQDSVFSEQGFEGTVGMPVPSLSTFRGYPLVQFEGISHILVPSNAFSDSEAEKAAAEFAQELGVPALGLMLCPEYGELVSSEPSCNTLSIRPLVYVPGSDTTVWEHGCATGSTAIGWYRWHNSGISHTQIKQPGGIIRVDVTGGLPTLTGKVVFRKGVL